MKKIGCIAAVVALLILAGFIGFKYYWVFGDGVKAGELNYITHKGYIFKTYEGKLIQSGFRLQGTAYPPGEQYVTRYPCYHVDLPSCRRR